MDMENILDIQGFAHNIFNKRIADFITGVFMVLLVIAYLHDTAPVNSNHTSVIRTKTIDNTDAAVSTQWTKDTIPWKGW